MNKKQDHSSMIIYKCSFKRVIYNLIKVISFAIITIMIFNYLSFLTKRKEVTSRMAEFFEQKPDYDVLFFGTSHVFGDIYPMQLWKEHGIVSYDMGQVTDTVVQSFYNLLLSLKETKPKLVVLDCHFITCNNKLFTDSDIQRSMHNTFDYYPISYTKYIAIKDIFDNKNNMKTIPEYLFYFSFYHSRWKELNPSDFKYSKSLGKGAEYLVKVEEPILGDDFDSVEIYNDKENINMEYLRKFIEYCHENDIEVLLTYLPFPAKADEIATSKYIPQIANEYNVKYINFLNMNIVNFDTDSYDTDSHINVSGARKVTKYLGDFIEVNYNIPDQRNNQLYNFWNEDYNKYIDFKIEELQYAEWYLDRYLMLLANEKDLSYNIKISSKYNLEENIKIKKLLENLNSKYEIDDSVFWGHENKNIFIMLYDNRDNSEISKKWF